MPQSRWRWAPPPFHPSPQYVSSQTCPPGMGWLLKRRRREVEGWRDWGMEVEVWECRGGGKRVGGVCINPSQADSWLLCPPWPRATDQNQARAGQLCVCMRVCVLVCVCVSVCISTPQPPDTHIYTSHPPSNSSHILLTISLPLSVSLPPRPVHDILQVNQSVSGSWHGSTAFIQSTPCLSYLLKYFYLNWPSNQSTFLPL